MPTDPIYGIIVWGIIADIVIVIIVFSLYEAVKKCIKKGRQNRRHKKLKNQSNYIPIHTKRKGGIG